MANSRRGYGATNAAAVKPTRKNLPSLANQKNRGNSNSSQNQLSQNDTQFAVPVRLNQNQLANNSRSNRVESSNTPGQKNPTQTTATRIATMGTSGPAAAAGLPASHQ